MKGKFNNFAGTGGMLCIVLGVMLGGCASTGVTSGDTAMSATPAQGMSECDRFLTQEVERTETILKAEVDNNNLVVEKMLDPATFPGDSYDFTRVRIHVGILSAQHKNAILKTQVPVAAMRAAVNMKEDAKICATPEKATEMLNSLIDSHAQEWAKLMAEISRVDLTLHQRQGKSTSKIESSLLAKLTGTKCTSGQTSVVFTSDDLSPALIETAERACAGLENEGYCKGQMPQKLLNNFLNLYYHGKDISNISNSSSMNMNDGEIHKISKIKACVVI